jgi:hypothetical protein
MRSSLPIITGPRRGSDIWLTGWLGNSLQEPFRLIGPVGAKSLMANLESAYALDIKIRLEDEKLPPGASQRSWRSSTRMASSTTRMASK